MEQQRPQSARFSPEQIDETENSLNTSIEARSKYELELNKHFPALRFLLESASHEPNLEGNVPLFVTGAVLGVGHILNLCERSGRALPPEGDFDYSKEALDEINQRLRAAFHGSGDAPFNVLGLDPVRDFTLIHTLKSEQPHFYAAGLRLTSKILQKPVSEFQRPLEDFRGYFTDLVAQCTAEPSSQIIFDMRLISGASAFLDGYAHSVVRLNDLLDADYLNQMKY
jgi:hypothetical protein